MKYRLGPDFKGGSEFKEDRAWSSPCDLETFQVKGSSSFKRDSSLSLPLPTPLFSLFVLVLAFKGINIFLTSFSFFFFFFTEDIQIEVVGNTELLTFKQRILQQLLVTLVIV